MRGWSRSCPQAPSPSTDARRLGRDLIPRKTSSSPPRCQNQSHFIRRIKIFTSKRTNCISVPFSFYYILLKTILSLFSSIFYTSKVLLVKMWKCQMFKDWGFIGLLHSPTKCITVHLMLNYAWLQTSAEGRPFANHLSNAPRTQSVSKYIFPKFSSLVAGYVYTAGVRNESGLIIFQNLGNTFSFPLSKVARFVSILLNIIRPQSLESCDVDLRNWGKLISG